MALRAGLIAFSLAACAWFALGARQAHELARASSIVSSPPLTRAAAREASSLLGAATTLNPDRTVDIVRAQLYADQRRFHTARAVLESVVHSEPENLQAWIYLTRFSYGAPATFARGVKAIGRLLRTIPPSP